MDKYFRCKLVYYFSQRIHEKISAINVLEFNLMFLLKKEIVFFLFFNSKNDMLMLFVLNT